MKQTKFVSVVDVFKFVFERIVGSSVSFQDAVIIGVHDFALPATVLKFCPLPSIILTNRWMLENL